MMGVLSGLGLGTLDFARACMHIGEVRSRRKSLSLKTSIEANPATAIPSPAGFFYAQNDAAIVRRQLVASGKFCRPFAQRANPLHESWLTHRIVGGFRRICPMPSNFINPRFSAKWTIGSRKASKKIWIYPTFCLDGWKNPIQYRLHQPDGAPTWPTPKSKPSKIG